MTNQSITHNEFARPEVATTQSTRPGATRKRLFLLLGAGVAIAATGIVGYNAFVGARHVETDNAYVGAHVTQVTPLIGGPVREVLVDDTRFVKRGDVLVRLDDTDARIALARAEADVAAAERKVRGMIATNRGLSAQVSARLADEGRAQAQISAARADLDKATVDLKRREALLASGSVSGDEPTAARSAFLNARAKLAAAESARAQAMIVGAGVDTNPEVLAARAALDAARVDLARTVIRAPVDGVITKRMVEVGQKVQPGALLMVIVPSQAAFVDANFKEVQLAKVRPGQPVTLHSDLYGSDVAYHGRVVGFSGGTGAAFAVVPAQNATGNWIKVVQRLPVRVALDPRELAAHPLRVGLSMDVDIDVSR